MKITKPQFRITINHEDDRREQWTFIGMGAEKRAFALMNSCTRRKTDFTSAVVDRHRHDGSWEELAVTIRSN